jgi:UDP-glucose 4-epimerase
MVHVDKLSEFIGQVVDRELDGLFFPQDEEYVNVSELAVNVKPSIKLSGFLGVVVTRIPVGVCRKVFGSLTYEKGMAGE